MIKEKQITYNSFYYIGTTINDEFEEFEGDPKPLINELLTYFFMKGQALSQTLKRNTEDKAKQRCFSRVKQGETD